jgi:hypothetical protein
MAQRPSFNLNRLSTASRILLIGGLLYFVDLFLPWQQVCIGFGTIKVCPSLSGWHGVGILNGILVILILVMEILMLANVEVNVGTAATRNMTEAGVAGGLLLFTIIKILVNHQAIHLWAWIGLVLAVIVAYGGYMRWQEASVTTPPPPAPGGGGGFAP